MATILDDQMAQAAVGAAVNNFVQVSARREVAAASDSEERLIEVREASATRRQGYQIMSNLVLNRITSDQTGSDSNLAEETLGFRAIQAQPEESTFNDPNYRPGAGPPLAPVAPKPSS